MKKLFLSGISGLMLVMVSLTAFAQESRSFSVSGFSKLEMGSAFKIDVKQGNKYSVTTSGRSEDLNDLEANVMAKG